MTQVKESQKFKVAHEDELKHGISKEIKIKDETIALFKLESGKVRAIENRCPHENGPLSQGIISGEYVFCPLHDWKICVDDGLVQAPDEGCVKTYPVDIEDGDIYITLK